MVYLSGAGGEENKSRMLTRIQPLQAGLLHKRRYVRSRQTINLCRLQTQICLSHPRNSFMSFILVGEISVSWQDNSLIGYTSICASKNSMFRLFVKVRSCGPAHNPSASGGLPFSPDTSPEFMNYQC